MPVGGAQLPRVNHVNQIELSTLLVFSICVSIRNKWTVKSDVTSDQIISNQWFIAMITVIMEILFYCAFSIICNLIVITFLNYFHQIKIEIKEILTHTIEWQLLKI